MTKISLLLLSLFMVNTAFARWPIGRLSTAVGQGNASQSDRVIVDATPDGEKNEEAEINRPLDHANDPTLNVVGVDTKPLTHSDTSFFNVTDGLGFARDESFTDDMRQFRGDISELLSSVVGEGVITGGSTTLSCCGNVEHPVCATDQNSCNEFARSLAPELSNPESEASTLTEIGSLLLLAETEYSVSRRTHSENININFCSNCYGSAFVKSAEGVELELDTYNQIRRRHAGIFYQNLINRKIENSIRAYHNYNEMLYRSYGVHAKKIDDHIRFSGGNESDYVCKNGNEILNKLMNPQGGKCAVFKAGRTPAQYKQLLSNRFAVAARSLEMAATGHIDRDIKDYFNGFEQAHVDDSIQCVSRARHGQFLAAQFHSPDSANMADLVYQMLGDTFPNSNRQERADLKRGLIGSYCSDENDAKDLVPLEILKGKLIGENSNIVLNALTNPEMSELKRLLIANEVTTENYQDKVEDILEIAQAMEPSIGLMLANKNVFCNHFIDRLASDKKLDFKKIITQAEDRESPSIIPAMQRTAQAQCAELERELIDSICSTAADITEATDKEVKDALAGIPNPSSDVVGPTGNNIIKNSLACQIGTPPLDAPIRESFSNHNMAMEGMLNHFSEDPEQSEDDHNHSSLAFLDFDFFNHGASKTVNDTHTCVGLELRERIENMYSQFGYSEEVARTLSSYDSSFVAIISPADTTPIGEGGGLNGMGGRRRGSEEFQGNKITENGGSHPSHGEEGERGITGPGGGSLITDATDLSGDLGSSVIPGLDGGDPATDSANLTDMDESLFEAGDSAEDLYNFQEMIEQQAISQQRFDAAQDRFNGSMDNIINDRDLNTSDVAQAVASDQNMQKDFDEIRDQIEDATGVTPTEANNKLVNALAGSDNGELAQQLGASSPLLAEIQQLRAQIESMKREEDAKEVNESANGYVSQLEERIRQLESNSSDPEVRNRARGTMRRAPASTAEVSPTVPNLPEGYRSIGGVRGGVPAYLSSQDGNLESGSMNLGNLMGNIGLVRKIMENPQEYGSMTLSYRDNKLFLEVSEKQVNEPVDIKDIILNSDGQVSRVVFTNDRSLNVSELNPESQQAVASYVEANIDQINQAQTEEVQELRQEIERVRDIQRRAAAVEGDGSSDSAYKELVCSFNSSDRLCQQ